MLRFVIRKMLSKKWMVLSLLIGNILLVSITAGNPMYSQAMLQRTLTKNLEAYLMEKNSYPGLAAVQLNRVTELGIVQSGDRLAAELSGIYGLQAVESLKYVTTKMLTFEPALPRDGEDAVRGTLSMLTDLPEHAEIVGGRMYADQPDADGVIDAVISEYAMVKMNLLLDEILTIPKITDGAGNPLQIRIAGVFKNSSPDDRYWVRTPSSFRDDCFIHPDLFEELFLSTETLKWFEEAHWFTLLDYTAMRGDDAQRLLTLGTELRDSYQGVNNLRYYDNFSGILEDYIKTAKQVNITLWVLQAPIFMLLAAFIFMVSRQMLDMERDEIAVVKSRGAGRGQIFCMYLLQSVLISGVAFAVGIPLGVYLCQVVGSANAFLEFVQRSALPLEVTPDALKFSLAASAFSVCAMVLPAVRQSKTSIVNQKQKKNRRSETPLWQKLWLDVILLGASLYGLYSFDGQREILAARVQEGASLDPLLFLSSSMFMVGAGLLAVRIMPLLVWLIFRPLRRFWSPALYASFLRVLRNRSSHSFIVVFMIMTIALGIFNAQAARTINQNAEDNLRYSIGADVVVKERWQDNSMSLANDPSAELVYYEPDYGRYEALEGAASMTKVYVDDRITARVDGGDLKNVHLMAIHTREFGETAWFKDSLSDVHWYHYLNAISQNSRAILVSRNFQTKYGCKLGDTISFENDADGYMRGVIYGFVDYFPGYQPVVYERSSDGLYKETEKFLIVANLLQIQSSWGVRPYEIWFKNEGSSEYLYRFAEENNISFEVFRDANAQLVEKKNDPVLQGTNGILTVGFIVVLTLCSVGFLIYWILSIKSRSLQFGIFRAMGMSMREVITMLLNEQLYISGLSIAVGALVGHLTAQLYMPLIQLAYTASDNALPLELISRTSDNVKLFAVIGAVMLLCMVILGGLISRMKIAQALKLGED